MAFVAIGSTQQLKRDSTVEDLVTSAEVISEDNQQNDYFLSSCSLVELNATRS